MSPDWFVYIALAFEVAAILAVGVWIAWEVAKSRRFLRDHRRSLEARAEAMLDEWRRNPPRAERIMCGAIDASLLEAVDTPEGPVFVDKRMSEAEKAAAVAEALALRRELRARVLH
jgi:hypothetical protein